MWRDGERGQEPGASQAERQHEQRGEVRGRGSMEVDVCVCVWFRDSSEMLACGLAASVVSVRDARLLPLRCCLNRANFLRALVPLCTLLSCQVLSAAPGVWRDLL